MKRDYWPEKEWRFAAPESLGMNAKLLSGLDSAISGDSTPGRFDTIRGIVVVKDGYIAHERCFGGAVPDDARHVASATKSIVSALIGIAVDQGYIKSIDQCILDFFPDYEAALTNEAARGITLRHLLTMTAPYPYEDWAEPLDLLSMSPDWTAYVLNMVGRGGSPGRFKYSTGGAHLLSAVITRSTGLCAREFANRCLFGPLGMRQIDPSPAVFDFDHLFGEKLTGWPCDPLGNSTGGWGLTLTPRDMARFGFLYINEGNWNGQQILSSSWVADSTSPRSDAGRTAPPNPIPYGYLWWLREECGENPFTFMALGDGGNAIYCVPKLDLVVAVSSDFSTAPEDRWVLMKEFILPSVRA